MLHEDAVESSLCFVCFTVSGSWGKANERVVKNNIYMVVDFMMAV